MQSFIGDWECGRWGDGKIQFPGLGAVSAIAFLLYQAKIAVNPELRKVFSQTSEELTKSLEAEIEAFKIAL